MGWYDPDWIIILFFIYLDAFRVEKFGGIKLQGHFIGRSQFGKLGSRTFQIHFEASKVMVSKTCAHPLDGVLPMVLTLHQLEFV